MYTMAKSYLIGFVNILAGIILASAIGILLIFQIKSYELNVSFHFGMDFFTYDPFATRLIILLIIAMVANFFSSVVMFSGLFGDRGFTLSFVYSLLTILWVVLYLGISFAMEMSLVGIVPIMMVVVILLLLRQLRKLKYMLPGILLTILVATLAVI